MARIIGNFAVLVGGALGFAGTVLSNQRVRRIGDCVLFVSQSAMLISSMSKQDKDCSYIYVGIGAFLSIWPSLRPLASFVVRACRSLVAHPAEVDHLKAEARSKMTPELKIMLERVDALPRDSEKFQRINTILQVQIRECFLSHEWIEDPVKIRGFYFERSAALQFIYNHGRMLHPFTRLPEPEGLRARVRTWYNADPVQLINLTELTPQELQAHHQAFEAQRASIEAILNEAS